MTDPRIGKIAIHNETGKMGIVDSFCYKEYKQLVYVRFPQQKKLYALTEGEIFWDDNPRFLRIDRKLGLIPSPPKLGFTTKEVSEALIRWFA